MSTPIYTEAVRRHRRRVKWLSVLRAFGMDAGFTRWERQNTFSDGSSWTPEATR